MRYWTWVLAGVFALAQTAAVAQELVFSGDAIAACISDADSTPNSQDCIGASADACIEATEGGYSTAGNAACLAAELAYWDDALNTAYGALLAIKEAEDTELLELGSAAAPQAPALRDMQRAWIAYRDQRCEFERTTWGGGSGGGPAVLGCHMLLTGQQALLLQDYAVGL